MSRGACLFAIAAIAMSAGCGAESWSFDHDAGGEDTDGAVLEDVGGGDAHPGGPEDAALEGGSLPEAAPGAEAGPGREAAPACSADGDCPSDAPLCGPGGACTRCTADADCVRDGGALVCNTSTGACVQCTSNSDCSASPLPYCYTVSDRCVQCLNNAECGFESICQLASHTCTKMF